MLDLYAVICEHEDCEGAIEFYPNEKAALARREMHLNDYKFSDIPHEPYIVTLVARKYAR